MKSDKDANDCPGQVVRYRVAATVNKSDLRYHGTTLGKNRFLRLAESFDFVERVDATDTMMKTTRGVDIVSNVRRLCPRIDATGCLRAAALIEIVTFLVLTS